MRQFIIILCLLLLVLPVWSQDMNDDSTTSQETVTVSKEEFNALKKRVADLEQRLQKLLDKSSPAAGEKTSSSEATGEAATELTGDESIEDTAANVPSAGKALALPDISFIAQAKGHVSTDKIDEERNTVRLAEGELGVQGWVYPNVKADAFISMSPQEDNPAQLEEAYLSYLGLRNGLNFYVGKKYVPFGRTNMLHSHSWPWVNRPVAFHNLVAEENLTGEGLQASFVIPTRLNLFAQLDLGTWAGGEEGESTNLPDIVVGPGAGFNNKFNTGRLWMGYPITSDDELELGGSYAEGDSGDISIPTTNRIRLTGADISYRHFGDNDRRLLLRGEQFWRRDLDEPNTDTAKGYYAYCDYRWDKYNSVGSLYSWSQFPQATDLHEWAASLIYTHQFSEQYYLRLQANHGTRPDSGAYDELWMQWVWGIGPHTHNLE